VKLPRPRSDRRVVFVTDQRLVGEAVALEIAGEEWETVVLDVRRDDLLQACRDAEPTVVAVLFDDPFLPPAGLVAELVESVPDAPVLVIAAIGSAWAAEVVRQGARGVLSFDASPGDVLAALRALATGHTVLPSDDVIDLTDGTVSARAAALRGQRLTGRERAILARVMEGQSTLEIARDLGIAPVTVRKHLQNVLTKLGVHSRLEAVAYAMRTGLM
jgi:DNA-binding NarL/FixJ family response regulator